MTRPDFTKQEVLKSGSLVAAAGIASTAMAAVLTTILGIELGDEGFGAYAFVIATAGLLATLARLGLGPIIVRDVARSVEPGLELGSRSPVLTALSVTAPVAVILALAVLSPPGQALLEMAGEMDTAMVAGLAVLLIGQTLYTINAESLRGLHHVAAAASVGLPVQRLVSLALVALAVFALPVDFDAAVAIWLTAVAALAAFAVSGGTVWSYIRNMPGGRASRKDALRMTRDGAPVLLTNLIGLASARLPVWVLPAVTDLGEAGVFALATAYVTLIRFGHKTMSQTLSPFIAESYLSGDHRDLQRRVRVAAAGTTVLALAASVVMVVAGTVIVPRLFPEGFADSVLVAGILLIGTVTAAAAGPCGLLLNVTGNERWMARASSISISLALVAVLPASAAGGAIGAAVVMAASTIVRVLLQLRYAMAQTGIFTAADFAALGRSLRRDG